MSEKDKEKKEAEEEVILDHFFHEHPLKLSLIEAGHRCYGCRRYIFSGETAYQCGKGSCRYPILHEECAEMPREITHSLHPQHTLIQKEVMHVPTCIICEKDIMRIGYYCSSSDSCKFQIHVGCAQSMDILHASASATERSCMQHPSHPQHDLTLLWRPGRAASLRCDACCTLHRGNFYTCNVCQYSIHQSCAALPATMSHRGHNHPLSLVYRLPRDYIKFDFKCNVCFKELLPKYWFYHCGICRYILHINCAIGASPSTMINIEENAADNKDVIKFPVSNAAEELIQPFVVKLGANENENENVEFKFHNPDHQLRLISSSLHDQEQEDDEDDDYDDLNYGKKSLICDGCRGAITISSSSTSNKYVSCNKCKYFLHLACSRLPSEIVSHPLHNEDEHTLILQSGAKLDFTYCYICRGHTNGLLYGCSRCEFKADIKCVTLPDTIKHAAHPQHRLKLLTREITREGSYWERTCDACGFDTYVDVCYRCDICQIFMHASCSLLPAAVVNPTWDKHPLPLTFDATLNHPSSFFCEVCEKEMNPKRWMYHCRECDVSVHPNCFPSASGEYRNIKFRQRYVVDGGHPHPLAFQLLTWKLHCDVCGKRKEYGSRGFQCQSDKCDFFMCLFPCGRDRRVALQLQPVD